jgi:AcrR family transcriptional regulator
MSNKKAVALTRVLEVAARHFVDQRFEMVSVSAIAHEAHCSTATIYECYGNKDNLFVNAMSRKVQECLLSLSTHVGDVGLRALLQFVRTRVQALCSPSGRAVCMAINRQPEITQRTLSNAMTEVRRDTESALKLLIESARSEGSLRPIAVDIIRYNIVAISAYEGTLFGLIYGIGTAIEIPTLLRGMFAPLVSDDGRQILDRFLGESFD